MAAIRSRPGPAMAAWIVRPNSRMRPLAKTKVSLRHDARRRGRKKEGRMAEEAEEEAAEEEEGEGGNEDDENDEDDEDDKG